MPADVIEANFKPRQRGREIEQYPKRSAASPQAEALPSAPLLRDIGCGS
jgi:hypothetical protein